MFPDYQMVNSADTNSGDCLQLIQVWPASVTDYRIFKKISVEHYKGLGGFGLFFGFCGIDCF